MGSPNEPSSRAARPRDQFIRKGSLDSGGSASIWMRAVTDFLGVSRSEARADPLMVRMISAIRARMYEMN